MSYFLSLVMSSILALLLSIIILPLLKILNAKQTILHYVERHEVKSGTPTMGGLIFIFSITIAYFLFSQNERSLSFYSLMISLCIGATGFLDDFIKIRLHKNEGLSPTQKIFSQIVLAGVVGFLGFKATLGVIYVPILETTLNLSYFSMLAYGIVFIACVNCVNLTDGLDGLATISTMVYMIFMGIVIYLISLYVGGLGQLVNFNELSNLLNLIIIIIGSLLGFIAVNCFPAKVFMGDTGSLFLGSLVACVGIFSGNVLYIAIFGLPFVVSGVSDILQVSYFKLTKGKRIFKMAPFHHHLELVGVHENRIVLSYALGTFLVSSIIIAFKLSGGL